jgi:hypothetical protein
MVLAIMASGCASGKWPWQSGGPFSSSSTPSKSTVSNGVPKPSTLAGNAPPSNVAAPSVTYQNYPGATTGYSNNSLAPGSQPTNPPTGGMAPTYTANSNNAAGRTGGIATSQQGPYPTNNTMSPNPNPAAGGYPSGSIGTPYNPTPAPTGGYGPAPNSGYGAAPNGNYGQAPNAGYGATNTPPSTPPMLTINGANSGVTPPLMDNSRSTININPNPGNTTYPQKAPLDNPVRQVNQPIGGDRYPAGNDRYGTNAGGADRYGSTDRYDTYGNPPAGSPDTRYAPAADPRYGDTYGNGDAGPAAYPSGLSAPPANGMYNPPANGSGSGTSTYRAGTTGGASGSGYANNNYQPGSVTSYEAANKPTTVTASNPATDPAVGTGYSR